MMKKRVGMLFFSAAAACAVLLSGCTASGTVTKTAESGSSSSAAAIGGASGPTGIYVGDDTIGVTQNVISTGGEGKIYVKPDQAELVFGIVSQGQDAKTVKDQNTAGYNQVVAFLKGQGFSDDSIQTSNLGLQPIYDWSGKTQAISGYSMETDISISDIPLDQLGGLIDNAVNSGINSIQSVTYSSSAFDEKYNEALKEAVANAKAKAEALAEAGNVKLGPVVNMTEYGADTTARYMRSNMAAGESGVSMSDTSMNIQPGQLEITADINVVFAVQ